ncbi:hypothetical protein GALMADRAFT_229073 [Galerina marginata CBS 339.88]|uniref:Polysaccharide lyase 14 domain-containing protein n=1 Tax=Galerina marginata (strain CBS 339.88) TaxID=685588 RepID=A0A067SX18_GALM3|nr:hypothetical protein GALMADRAFT_229073 [Galerina marginata CBS 339.88]
MEEKKVLDISHLIPKSDFTSGFTTCELIEHARLELVLLDDGQLGVHKVSSGTTHRILNPPTPLSSVAPKVAWEALYPKGSVNPTGEIPGGFGFYMSGPSAFRKQLETASEVIYSYRLMLQDGWEWVKGGKLPGVFGGVGDLSYGCTGGRQERRCQCFDLRPMWRPKSAGELYAYLPLTPENTTQLSSVPPFSVENSDYGFSVGRGAFLLDIAVGNWVTLAFRIKLNDVGSRNGEIQIWMDGKSVMEIDGLTFRESEAGRIKGMHFQTFFGGHGKDWASPKDQRAWFADVTGVIIQ